MDHRVRTYELPVRKGASTGRELGRGASEAAATGDGIESRDIPTCRISHIYM